MNKKIKTIEKILIFIFILAGLFWYCSHAEVFENGFRFGAFLPVIAGIFLGLGFVFVLGKIFKKNFFKVLTDERDMYIRFVVGYLTSVVVLAYLLISDGISYLTNVHYDNIVYTAIVISAVTSLFLTFLIKRS
jgi:hypothetical protein